MKKKKKRRKSPFGLLLILLGLLLITGAVAYTFRNLKESEDAGAVSAVILEKLEVRTADRELVLAEETIPVFDHGSWDDVEEPVPQPPVRDMSEEEIDGYEYIGIIEIPSLSIQLPVMAEWDYERLKYSPCRFMGNYLTDNMIICAHNYNRHFGPIRWIGLGADVYFITVDKVVYHYIVDNVEIMAGNNLDQMIGKRTDDDSTMYYSAWDLTLFTCDATAQMRYAVRCLRVRDE